MIKATTYIAFDGKEFDYEKECRDYEKSKIINITKEMTDELNQLLNEMGCIFEFEFDRYSTDKSIGVIRPKFINRKFLSPAMFCYTDSDCYRFVYDFLKSKGIDRIVETGSGGIIAYQHDDKVY